MKDEYTVEEVNGMFREVGGEIIVHLDAALRELKKVRDLTHPSFREKDSLKERIKFELMSVMGHSLTVTRNDLNHLIATLRAAVETSDDASREEAEALMKKFEDEGIKEEIEYMMGLIGDALDAFGGDPFQQEKVPATPEPAPSDA